MPAQASISNTRRSDLTQKLAQFAYMDNAAVPALLAKLPAYAGFQGWQPTIEEVSDNIQRLLAYAEANACFSLLEDAVANPAAAGQAPTDALARARAVAVTQIVKDALAVALRQWGSNPKDLRKSVETALGGRDVSDRVTWLNPIAEVAQEVVDETQGQGMLPELVAGLHNERPRNRELATFVRTYYAMLYNDPILSSTSVSWATHGSAFDAILVARRTPFVDRRPVRDLLTALFRNPVSRGNIVTITGPSRAGKSYVSRLIEFLIETGMRGHPDTVPHTQGQHRFALLRPSGRGALHTVTEVAADMLSQLGWMHLLPEQHKSDDGWAREVILNFRNELTKSEDVVWVVADKYWNFADSKVVVDFFVSLADEAHLLQGRNKLRLVLIDFPAERLEEYITERGDAQFENVDLTWLTPQDIQQFCSTFVQWRGAANDVFATVEARVDRQLTGDLLQQSWCNSLKQELAKHW
jgi:hypothetical protein